MNVVVLYGRLTRDPELKYSQGGVANCFATVAVDRGMTKEKRQEAEAAGRPTADFISIKAFGKTAELLANYFRKGNRVALEGRIQTGSYEKNDERVYTTDVIVNRLHFVESAKENGGGNVGSFAPMNGQAGYYEVNEKDVPF
ncbi:single-stranded DNA-binding protein [Aedoeadaptatus acetigenes]|uniref:Single-stranded DNA-binding protein n=1 Tax=Aedoeadaptatus acetigenes TaxID=2981723 RepID=A0ABV1J4L1_9FIRM